MLGRPMGAPGDPEFQRQVLIAALRLLESTSGPVLEDYPHDAPSIAEDEAGGFACPVNFARGHTDDSLENALQREIAELAPWHSEAVRTRGRTSATLSGLTPAAAGKFITDLISGKSPPVYRDEFDIATALRLVCEDLKAYYLEAVAQPGARAAAEAREWLWRETVAGKAFSNYAMPASPAVIQNCSAMAGRDLSRYLSRRGPRNGCTKRSGNSKR